MSVVVLKLHSDSEWLPIENTERKRTKIKPNDFLLQLLSVLSIVNHSACKISGDYGLPTIMADANRSDDSLDNFDDEKLNRFI